MKPKELIDALRKQCETCAHREELNCGSCERTRDELWHELVNVPVAFSIFDVNEVWYATEC